MNRLILAVFAILLIFFGFYGLRFLPKVIQKRVESKLELKIGTEPFERFERVPIPITVKYHLFNITNRERVLAGLERPNFQEVGPFVYKQWRRRDIIDLEDENKLVRYREYKTFYPSFSRRTKTGSKYHPQSSPEGYLDPAAYEVTLVNLPLLSLLTQLSKLEVGSLKRKIAQKIVSRFIAEGNEKILVTRPANEFLFDGYKVGFMEAMSDLLSETLGFNFEPPLPNNKFGFFYGKNGTWSKREAGELTIVSGRHGTMDNFMQVKSWNDQRQLNVWPTNTEAGDRCNQINGTDGSSFRPGVSRNAPLYIFSPLICSSIQVKYMEDVEVRGIPLYRFTMDAETFGAPKKSAKNACYCTVTSPQQAPVDLKQNRKSALTAGGQQQVNNNSSTSTSTTTATINDSRCYLDGLIDLSLCQRGAPVAASGAHFYNADPNLALAAGLNPKKELHETHLDVEPITGAVMRAASRAQLNAYVEEAALGVFDSKLIGQMRPMVAPLIWIEESAEIDENSANKIKSKLFTMVNKIRRYIFIVIGTGIFLLVAVAIQSWYLTCYATERRSAGNVDVFGRAINTGSRGSKSRMGYNLHVGAGAKASNKAAQSGQVIDPARWVLLNPEESSSKPAAPPKQRESRLARLRRFGRRAVQTGSASNKDDESLVADTGPSNSCSSPASLEMPGSSSNDDEPEQKQTGSGPGQAQSDLMRPGTSSGSR